MCFVLRMILMKSMTMNIIDFIRFAKNIYMEKKIQKN